MVECIVSLMEVAVLSTLDVNSGYWQMKVKETDLEKTAFTPNQWLYRFIQMPNLSAQDGCHPVNR